MAAGKIKRILPVTTKIDKEGKISIGGSDLHQLAADFGTPLYIYDAETIRQNIRTLQEALAENYPASKSVAYASKAYLSLQFARRIVNEPIDLDVVSLGEMIIARKARFDPERVHFHGNNKSDNELKAAIEWGTHTIVIDSLEELAIVEQMAKDAGKKVRIWLRITPDIHVETHPYIETSAKESKFGLHISDGEARQGIETAMRSDWLDLVGLHTHLGSQLFDPEPYAKAVEMLLSLAASCGYMPKEISPGGGWGVPATINDPEADPELWIKTCAGTIKTNCERLGMPLPKLILEPGRFIAARAGTAIYRVGFCKRTVSGTTIVSVDGGMADNPRHSLYGAKYTALIAGKVREKAAFPTRIVGKFCESGDTLIDSVKLPATVRGDVLVIPVSGAYQLSMASNYNLAPRPTVLWLEKGRFELLQSQENPEENGWFL